MTKFIDEFKEQIVYIMLSIDKIFDNFKKKNMIFVNAQKNNKRNKFLIFEIYLKFIEDRDDVQFENVFTFNHFN